MVRKIASKTIIGVIASTSLATVVRRMGDGTVNGR
jgi:hypothetical protein